MDPKLGLAGGVVVDVVDGKVIKGRQYMENVAGATQFFRKECFESLGGLVAIPEGGWDAITCVVARANGFRTATFADLRMEHLKPRNVSKGNIVSRYWQLGIREYTFGYHPLFETLKCLSRSLLPPVIIGSSVRFAAFFWCHLMRRKRMIDRRLINMIQDEQMCRILPWLKFSKRNRIFSRQGH